MGRKKGSKNKPKGGALAETISTDNLSPDNNSKQEGALPPPPLKRGRGRPKGSKNKLQDDELAIKKDNLTLVGLFGNTKDIKKEIRRLKKVKLQCRAGSKERITLHRQIQELKSQLTQKKIGNDDKDSIIKEIRNLDAPYYRDVDIDFYKFTVEQLQFHLNKLKGGRHEVSQV